MKIVAQKFLYLFVMLFAISLISFIAVHLAPNSFFASGELNPNITGERIAHLKAIYNLDKPFYIQFFSWIVNILSLDFGISFSSGESVKDEIISRLPITLILNITSMIFIFLLSLYFGVKSALHSGGKFDKFVEQLSILSFSLPSFYLALILTFVFSITFPIFPISGVLSDNSLIGFSKYRDMAWHLALPIFIIVFGGIGNLILYIRSLTLEVLKSDYIFFAKARGLSQATILRFYILPNLYPTIVT
ncbi:MAG: ABC transporter permease, partial [Arcobacter sp.]|nr:ABC transporter permease [Arcobacter sp.]